MDPEPPGAQPGTKMALKTALYARLYPAPYLKPLRATPLHDLAGEILNLRAAARLLTEVLYREEMDIKERVSAVRALAALTDAIVRAVAVDAGRAAPANPARLAWDAARTQLDFFQEMEVKP